MNESFSFRVKCPYCGVSGYVEFIFTGIKSKPVKSVQCGCGKVFHAEASIEKHVKTYEPVPVEFD